MDSQQVNRVYTKRVIFLYVYVYVYAVCRYHIYVIVFLRRGQSLSWNNLLSNPFAFLCNTIVLS
jgi:hypothetical protein